jgi:predicted NACHT family NTPase
LSTNARLQTLATNPLLLSLIAIVYERDLELPERRAALYRRCVEVLLREWDAHRKIAR